MYMYMPCQKTGQYCVYTIVLCNFKGNNSAQYMSTCMCTCITQHCNIADNCNKLC